jgi:mannose/fructose/N-acetylgalactosamine-specific phosphotransferase system component IID
LTVQTVEAARSGTRVRREPGAWTLVWRALPLQAAFNPVTLQGAGFARALLPELVATHGPAAGVRAAELAAGFNANPYLATFAIGATAVAEGREPAARIDRFLRLVRGPLGSLGDGLFWGAARPALLIPAALAICAGLGWWVALAALVPWNLLAFGVRLTGARAGLARGLDVAADLGRSWIRSAPARIRKLGGLAIGLGSGLVLSGAVRAADEAGAGAHGAVAGPAGWLALGVFALATPLFALWPRRWGWGAALLAGWALLALLPV